MHVLINPPFHEPAAAACRRTRARAAAHVLGDGGLDAWFRAAASILKSRGDLTVIFRADGLDDAPAAAGRRFGAFDILPIHPRPARPAHRDPGARASRAAAPGSACCPPLVLHGETGNAFVPAIEAMLRQGRGIAGVNHAWHASRGNAILTAGAQKGDFVSWLFHSRALSAQRGPVVPVIRLSGAIGMAIAAPSGAFALAASRRRLSAPSP